MNPDLSKLFPKASARFIQLNSGVNPAAVSRPTETSTIAVRQRSGSGLNKTEARFLNEVLELENFDVKAHGLTLVLANGVKYTPDFIAQGGGILYAYEVKAMRGKRVHVEDDASVKIKVAAQEWPSIKFIITWWDKTKHAWQFQEVTK